MAYTVKNWDSHFENSESRKVKHPRWVAVPNRHDGKSYRRLLKHPRHVEVFCAWCLILQVASRMPTRGILADEDGDLTAEDLSDKTGFPAEMFEIALNVLSSNKIGWICDSSTSGESPGTSGESPGTSGDAGMSSRRAGVEGNGREGNGIEGKGTLSAGADDEGGRKGTAATGKAKAKGKPKADAKPEVAEVRSHFTSAWNRRYGGTYAWKHGKDDAHARWILDRPDVANNVEKAKAVVDAYFATEDAWYVERRHPIGLLVSGFNRFSTDPPDPFGPSDFEPTDAILSLIPGPQPVVGSPIE